jgi:DNA-binding XRE family transcriptional regulator
MHISYPENPVTIGDHIRKKRMQLRLCQSDVAIILKVSEATVCNWENNRNAPLVNHYPFIIEFLGYFPFEVDSTTFGGKLKEYRYKNGLTQEDMGKALRVNESTVFNWERGQHVPFPKTLNKLVQLFETNPEPQ